MRPDFCTYVLTLTLSAVGKGLESAAMVEYLEVEYNDILLLYLDRVR